MHTISVPVVGELHQLYEAADEGAIVTLLAKLAVEKSYTAKLDETRQVPQVEPFCLLQKWLCLCDDAH